METSHTSREQACVDHLPAVNLYRWARSVWSSNSSSLKIKNDIRAWLRAADKHISVGGSVEWLWAVTNRTADQTSYARVTHPGPARPSHRNVAGFRQCQQTLELRIPCDGESTACKGDGWTRSR